MERIVLAKTKLNVSGKVVDVTIIRNEGGNLERHIKDEVKLFPNGTTLDGYNEEIIINEYVK